MFEYCKECGQDLYDRSKYVKVDISYCHDCAFHKLAKEYLKKEEEKGNKFLDVNGMEIEPIDWVECFMVEELEQELNKMEYPVIYD